MKSTAIFLGVNVAVSIPLVICQQANAEGEAQLSGTADFLKSSLAKNSDAATAKSMLAGEPSFSAARRQIKIKRDLTPTQAFSDPRAVATRQTLAPIGGVKLRPFVAGRKLPSKAELESSLSAMSPQFDNGSDPAALSAVVTESYTARQGGQEYSSQGYGNYRPTDQRAQNRARLKDAARVASGYDRRSAPRSLPNQSVSTPGQVGFPCAQQAVANMQPVRNSTGFAANSNDWPASDGSMQGMSPGMGQGLGANMAEAPPPPTNTAGPAPFPLNLLPEASLKQFIGGTAAAGKRPPVGAPSYFGSWKGSQQIASGKPALQPSGFHTYLGGDSRSVGTGSHIMQSSSFKSYAPMAMSNHHASPSRPAEPVKHIAQNVHASASVQVATYGPYVSHQNF